MKQSNSPVLSYKKFCKSPRSISPDSPILSDKRKRKRQILPDSSPVILRTAVRTYKSYKGKESPVISSFYSPPANNSRPAKIKNFCPKSLFVDIDDSPLTAIESQQSQASSTSPKYNIIAEEESSDDTGSDIIILERTMSDSEDKLNFMITDARSQNSITISQTSSYYSGISTPEKRVVKAKPVATGSTRKKKLLKPNGMAKKLSKLLVRQESDYHLWKFQKKLCTSMSETVGTLRLRIESLSPGKIHSFAHCCNLATASGGEGSLSNRVSLVFSPERWERFNNVRSGDIVSIYQPWQSMKLEGGVTLLLDFNLLWLQREKKEVSKLSNSDGLLLSCTNDTTLGDLTDAVVADGRACSSASADSIAIVAENRRPSTVTVLQTWTCPCEGCSLCHFNNST